MVGGLLDVHVDFGRVCVLMLIPFSELWVWWEG